MCGLVGLVNLKNATKHLMHESIRDLRSAMDVSKHRGPDDQGVCGFCFDTKTSYSVKDAFDLNPEQHINGIIGFNRLSIKDLSLTGHQPMTALGGQVILAFNGEIYNDCELKKLLKERGYQFKGTSDTEVILASYMEFGFSETLMRLNGMFAIVIIDLRNDKLFMARDRFGIKPLYYTFQSGCLIFASELKSIIQFSCFKRELDLNAVNARLVFSRPSNRVLLARVEMLDPGHAISFSRDADPRSWRYFDIDAYERNNNKYSKLEEALEEAEAVLSDAASRQMISDVKVGCQLSGGIDSTLVSYYANKMVGDRLNDGVSIIDDAGDLGEEHYINHVGRSLSLDLHKFKLDPGYFLSNYEGMIWHNDAPPYKPFFICFYKLAENAKQYVTVLLSGEGSDEVAGGYSRFACGVFQPFVSRLGAHASNLVSYDSYAEYAVKTDTTLTSMLSIGWEGLSDLLQEQMDVFNGFSGSNFTKQIKFEMTQRLPEALMRQDKMTMANSIENRVPFLDNEVVDFVMQLPESLLVRFVSPSPLTLSDNPFEWASGKYIFKELCAKKFGHDFAYRRKEIMVLDERAMLSSLGFKEYFYDSVYPGMSGRGLLDAELVRSWFDSISDISNKSFNSMWRAITLETWCQLFLDTRSPTGS